MDLATWLGCFIGIGAILLGHILEGSSLGAIFQGTAAIIVFGGTLGAILVSHNWQNLKLARRLLFEVFFQTEDARITIAGEIIVAAQLARRDSILALEKKLQTFTDPYMKAVFRFVVDGVEPSTIKEIFENEISVEEHAKFEAAKVFHDAGGFAPTIGIIGAVLGLIHVMENLTDTTKLGGGIAVAFVATIYGVGSANLIFLPLSNKIKRRIRERTITKEMILTGALAVLNGLNPYLIEEKLQVYTKDIKV